MATKNSKKRGRMLDGGNWRDPDDRMDPMPPRMVVALEMTGACCKTCDKWFSYGSSNTQRYCSRACHRKDRYENNKG